MDYFNESQPKHWPESQILRNYLTKFLDDERSEHKTKATNMLKFFDDHRKIFDDVNTFWEIVETMNNRPSQNESFNGAWKGEVSFSLGYKPIFISAEMTCVHGPDQFKFIHHSPIMIVERYVKDVTLRNINKMVIFKMKFSNDEIIHILDTLFLNDEGVM
ncbi:13145_t:CDS:2, partial [Dentiscutata heterogama]